MDKHGTSVLQFSRSKYHVTPQSHALQQKPDFETCELQRPIKYKEEMLEDLIQGEKASQDLIELRRAL